MFLRGVLAGVFLTLVGIAAIGALARAFSQTYAVTTVTAYHFDRHKGYNERNFGLGIEQRVTENWSVSAGYFKNSFYRKTVYVLGSYTPVELLGWRVGATMGGVTGYTRGVAPWLTGVAMRDFGPMGVNIAFSYVGVAMQLKWRID